MPQLLLELFSEEIPARMQAQAARDLERMARERLAEAGFLPEGVKAFAGPRRLTLVVDGLAPAQSDRHEERKGPRANAPEQAVEGFLRSTGLARSDLVERDGVLFAITQKKGRPTPEIVAEMVDQIVRGFPWPKSMTWGTGKLRWVRPLQSILCVFDGEVVPFAIDGVVSGDMTKGHRFMGGRQSFRARTFEQYAEGLAANFVVLDAEERKARILHEARTLCHARNLELVEDEGLLDEVCGLAEWPTPILGDMDPAFLDLPPEVIRTSMRTHQKYFAVRDPATGRLAPHFLVVANIEAIDGGAAIAAGNARVLSARLNDAKFFWDEDRKVTLESRLEKLKGVTFHAKLGTMYERVERISALARHIAPMVGADMELAERAARLAKADLGSGMVGEFPELQGLMGGYYARAEGLDDEIADAVRDHYKPVGPSDSVPAAPVSVAVALAEKLDTLAGFFRHRREADRIQGPLRPAPRGAWGDPHPSGRPTARAASPRGSGRRERRSRRLLRRPPEGHPPRPGQTPRPRRRCLRLGRRRPRPRGRPHRGAGRLPQDRGWQEPAGRLPPRDQHPQGRGEEGPAARGRGQVHARRAGRGDLPAGRPARGLAGNLKIELENEQFTEALGTLAQLRSPVDAFFDKVLVNAEDAAVRQNRLRLLAQVRDAMGLVADFSLIAG